MIDSFGSFTVGLSNAGDVYVWGATQLGTTGLDMKDIMALMGGLSQNQSTNNNTALSGGSNVGDILGLLTGLTSTNTSNKKKPTSGVDLSDGLDLGDILGLVGGAASTNTSN